jgi:hypothetical protein
MVHLVIDLNKNFSFNLDKLSENQHGGLQWSLRLDLKGISRVTPSEGSAIYSRVKAPSFLTGFTSTKSVTQFHPLFSS